MKSRLLLILFVGLSASQAFAGEEELSVKVKETALRQAPQYWSPAIGGLKYGQRFKAEEAENGWVRTSGLKKNGYVHSSALSSKQIVFYTEKVGSEAVDSSDVLLAGKGFSKETEAEFAKANSSLDFASVDRVERVKVSDAELASFRKVGKLNN